MPRDLPCVVSHGGHWIRVRIREWDYIYEAHPGCIEEAIRMARFHPWKAINILKREAYSMRKELA